MKLTSQFYQGAAMVKKDKRRIILDAAESLFLSRRFDQATLEDVRLKAHVGKGTIYRYFTDKEDLYTQMVLSGLDDLHALLKEKALAARTPDARLLAAAEALRAFYRERRNLFQSAHAEFLRGAFRSRDLHKEIHEHWRRTADLIASVIEEGKSERSYRSDIPAQAAARMFLAMMRAADGGPDSGRRQRIPVARVVSIFLDGMRRENRK